MPNNIELTKYSIWGIDLLQRFFDALLQGELRGFLKSDELERFLHGATGAFGDKVPEGTPGSEFPDTGSRDPLGVLHDIFHSIGSDMGETDRPDDSDPAFGDHGGTNSDVDPAPGTIQQTIIKDGVVTIYSEGRKDVYTEQYDVASLPFSTHATYFDNGRIDKVEIYPDGAGGTWWDMSRTENGITRTVHSHHDIDSPGEDGGGDTNSNNNPLNNIDIRGLQSVEQMLKGIENPGKDDNELDPNSKTGTLGITESDKERLGLVIPVAEKLDPNSGIDPLTQFNFDPNTLHTRSEDDDRIDPNTGLKPVLGN